MSPSSLKRESWVSGGTPKRPSILSMHGGCQSVGTKGPSRLQGVLRDSQLPENRRLCSFSASPGTSRTTDAGLHRDSPALRLERYVLLQETEGSEKA